RLEDIWIWFSRRISGGCFCTGEPGCFLVCETWTGKGCRFIIVSKITDAYSPGCAQIRRKYGIQNAGKNRTAYLQNGIRRDSHSENRRGGNKAAPEEDGGAGDQLYRYGQGLYCQRGIYRLWPGGAER